MKVDSLARWPLLMGAVIMFGVALWESSHETESGNTISEVSVAVACILLGSWIVTLIVEAERKHHRQTSAPPATGETQDGAEGS